jgi:hypothetical protein
MFDLELLALIGLFFIFIYIVYQGIRILLRYLIIAFASALFPFVLVKLFGVDIPLNLSTILVFIYLGIIGYSIYLGLGVVEKIARFVVRLFRGKKEENK